MPATANSHTRFSLMVPPRFRHCGEAGGPGRKQVGSLAVGKLGLTDSMHGMGTKVRCIVRASAGVRPCGSTWSGSTSRRGNCRNWRDDRIGRERTASGDSLCYCGPGGCLRERLPRCQRKRQETRTVATSDNSPLWKVSPVANESFTRLVSLPVKTSRQQIVIGQQD